MSLSKTLLLVGVGAASAAAGVAIPLVTSGGTKVAKAEVDPAPTQPADKHSAEKKAEKPGSHDHSSETAKAGKTDQNSAKSDGSGKGSGGHADSAAASGPQFVPFGRIVVNLNEPALTKYLSLDITLLADGKDEASVKDAVDGRLPILRTWLTSHLADKSMEDVRGKVGVNRLRREIQDQFNALLFDDGRERVRDVLFEEFHVE